MKTAVPEVNLDPLDAAIEQATELLLKFCVPLYQLDRNGRPLLNGTGFFVRAGKSSFLVSAAHVLDTAASHGLFFYVEPGTIRHLSGHLIRSQGEGNRDSDLIDVGVLQLSEDSVPPYPNVDKVPMDISYLRAQYRPRTAKDYVFIGFPATKCKVSGANREVLASPYAFRNEPLDEADYEAQGLHPDTHIALKLNVRKGFGLGGKPQHFPIPQGMSGSPIVVLYDREGPNDERVFPVVGVATTYRKTQRVVFGTDIGYVIDAIENAV
ncbi:MAG: hypothetical protein KF776_07045 [Burkholderiales bacterium]|nr:hypothetical protein [Burkholderiales bacterium]